MSRQAHPEKFLIHEYIGAAVSEFYIYIATIRLLNSTCQCLLGVCMCDEVACSMYIYIHEYCRYCIYTLSLFDIHICAWYIYMYVLPLFVYSTPLTCWERDCVDKVVCSICICMSVDVVSKSMCILPLFVYSTLPTCWECACMYITTICLLNSAYLLGVRLCGRSRVLDVYIHLPILSQLYIHMFAIWCIYMCLIYIYILPLFVSVHKSGLKMWIWPNVTSVGMAGTASRRDERKTRFSQIISIT